MKFVRFLSMLLIAFTLTYNSYGQGNLPFGQATSRSRCLGELQTDSGLRFQPRILGKFKGTNDSGYTIQVSNLDNMPYYSPDNATWYPLVGDTGASAGIPYSDTNTFVQTKSATNAAIKTFLSYPLYDTLTIFNTNLQNSLPTGFTLAGTHGTFTSSGLQFSGNTGNYNDYIEYSTPTMVEKCMQSITFVWQGKTSSDYGIQVGFHSINPFGYEHTVNGTWISNTNTIFHGVAAIDYNEGHIFYGSLPDTAYSVGDTMRYDLVRMETTYTITITNITKKWSTYYVQQTTPSGYPFPMHNTANPRITDLKISALVINWNYKIFVPKGGVNSVVIGNSITGGQAAAANNRFVNLLNGYSKDIISGGGADGVAQALAACKEVITLNPKYALIMMGGNDVFFGVDSNTWQSNLKALRDTFAHAGITVIHLLPTPRTATDERILKNYILRTFTSDHIIDTWTPLWDDTTAYKMLPVYNAGDNVHPNVAGHALIASTINQDTFYKQQSFPVIDTFNTMASQNYVANYINANFFMLATTYLDSLRALKLQGYANASMLQVGTKNYQSTIRTFINSDSSGAIYVQDSTGVDKIKIDGDGMSIISGKIVTGDSVLQNIGIDIVGSTPLPKITTGSGNLSIGMGAAQFLTIGSGNTALGYQALKSNRAGSANTCLGYNTMANDTSGSNNTIVGYRSGPIVKNNTNATWVGSGSGDGKNQSVGCTYYGYGAGGTNGSNNIQRTVTGQLFLGLNIGTQDSTDYDWGIGYNSTNNYGNGLAVYGNFTGNYINLNGNDTVNGTWSIKTIPAYTSTGNADSMLIVPASSNGTIFKRAASIRATGTLDFPSTNSLNQSTLTISVTGAKAGDPVSVGVPSTSTTGSYTAACFADGVVSVIFSNVTGGTIDPASGAYTVVVSK